MGKKSFDWFRLYSSEFLSDKKLRRIAIASGEDLATVRGVYVALLCLANESPDRDGYIALTEGLPALADEILPDLGLPAKRAEKILAQMEAMTNMLDRGRAKGWFVINFAARQTYGDTTNARRQAEYRERQKEKQKESRGNGPEDTPHPAKDKRSTAGEGHPDIAHDSTPGDRLAQFFENETGFFGTADPTTDANHWSGPCEAWLELVGGEERKVEELIRAAIRHHRENRIPFTRPSSLDGVIRKMISQSDLKRLWAQAADLMSAFGADNEPQDLDGDLGQIIKAAGGWRQLCRMNKSVAREKFAEAYGLARSHGRRTDKTGRS